MKSRVLLAASAVAVAILTTACEANAIAEGHSYGYEVYGILAPDPLSPRLTADDWTLATLKCSSRAKNWNPDDPADERAFKRACLEAVLEEQGVAVDRLAKARREQESHP